MKKKADILEIFSSVQGEGLRIGQRQIFLRFGNCNLNCSFCDTDKNNQPDKLSLEDILHRIDDLNASHIHNWIALTGGEPLMQAEFLQNLLPCIIDRGLKIYLETNGTLTDKLCGVIEYIDMLSVDIKLPSVSRNAPCWQEHESFIQEAFKKELFIKAVVSEELKLEEFDKAVGIIKNINFDIPFVIQPETKKASRELNISGDMILSLQERALKILNSVFVIPQAHKMLGVK